MTQPCRDMPGERDWVLRYKDALNAEFDGWHVRIVGNTEMTMSAINVVRRPPVARCGPYEVLVGMDAPELPKRRVLRMARWLRLLIRNGPAWSIKTDYINGSLIVYGKTWYGDRTPPVLRVEHCTPERALRELALFALAGEPEQ